jgi:hypothetical protein
MRRKITKYEPSSDIPTIQKYRTTWNIDEVDTPDTHENISILREGLIGHIDKVVWEVEQFTYEQRDRFIDIYKDTYENANVNDYPHYDFKWHKGRFRRQAKIQVYPLILQVNWKRDPHRQFFAKYDGIIIATWERKQDYGGYHDHLRQVEHVMELCGLVWRLAYVELDQDTVSPEVGNILFKHMVLFKGYADQIMWCDKDDWWIDKQGKKHERMKKGTNIKQTNHYQNKGEGNKQLCCHLCTKKEDYFDDELQSHIWRAELRIRRAVIEKYGVTIGEIIAKQAEIFDEHVLWRQINAKRLRGLRMDYGLKQELQRGYVIHYINRLVQRGISNSEVRERWVLPIKKLVCKYL